jgi:peptidyl-prolyl cis-trans isomerase SurA
MRIIWLDRSLILAALLLSFVVPSPAFAQRAEFIDRIVAVVNEDAILSSELAQEVFTVRDQLRATKTPLPSADVLEKQVLERLIMNRLQVQAARRSGLRIDERTLNQALQRIADQNQLNLSQFRERLEEGGYNYEQFRERIRAQILIDRMNRRQIETRVSVPEREIDSFLANEERQDTKNPELRLAQILFALPDGASADEIDSTRARADEVMDRLAAGDDFAELAVTHSNGRKALEGGVLGWKKLSELPRVFSEALTDVGESELTQMIRTGAGFHIVKVLSRRAQERVLIQQTNARHILISPGELATEDEAVKRLEQLRERVILGDDFAPLAKSHSDDRGSALRGGDLKWLNPGDTVPTFEREMDALDPGEVSEPFRTQFGWHIVQVVERREHDGTSAVRRTRAREAIRRRKSDEELQSWQRQLRDEAYVELRLDNP